MNDSRILAIVGLLSLTLGCASVRNGEPDGFQRSLSELRQKHNPESDPMIGTIPIDLSGTAPTFAAVGIPAPAFDDIEQRKTMGFLRGSDEEICFGLVEKLEWNDYGNLRSSEEADFIAARRKRMESGEFYVEAFEALVDVPTRPVLLATNAQRLTVRNAEMGLEVKRWKERVYDANGDARSVSRSSSQKEMMYDVCGPAPSLAGKRYVTVAHKFKEASLGDNYTHFLYVFERRDEGVPSLDGRGLEVATATGAAPQAQEPDETVASPATHGNLTPKPATEVADSAPAVAPDKGATSKMMAVEKARVDAKARFTVKFKRPLKPKKSEKYWIAIANASDGDADYLSYQYIEVVGAKSIELTAPDASGDFEVRLHGRYPTKKINVVDRLKIAVK